MLDISRPDPHIQLPASRPLEAEGGVGRVILHPREREVEVLMQPFLNWHKDTYNHSFRVSDNTVYIAQCRGDLGPVSIEAVRQATVLHDIGKLWTPQQILMKKGRLTEEEQMEISRHTDLGGAYLEKYFKDPQDMPFRQLATDIARYHHTGNIEREHLVAAGIIDPAINSIISVVQVADMHDALAFNRDYKPGFTAEEVLRIMDEQFKNGYLDESIREYYLQLIAQFKLEESLVQQMPLAA